jgi:hypothetical protein
VVSEQGQFCNEFGRELSKKSPSVTVTGCLMKLSAFVKRKFLVNNFVNGTT